MKALFGVLAAPLLALFNALGAPFRHLPFCSLPGAIIGAMTGFLMAMLLLAMPGLALSPQQLVVAGLLFGFVSLLLVLFLFGLLLQYGVAQIFAAALGNALVTAIVVVFVTYWMKMPALGGIVGLLLGVLIGAMLCWICGLDARRTRGAT